MFSRTTMADENVRTVFTACPRGSYKRPYTARHYDKPDTKRADFYESTILMFDELYHERNDASMIKEYRATRNASCRSAAICNKNELSERPVDRKCLKSACATETRKDSRSCPGAAVARPPLLSEPFKAERMGSQTFPPAISQ